MNRKTKIYISLNGNRIEGAVCSEKNILDEVKRESANVAKTTQVFDLVAVESRDSKLFAQWWHNSAANLVSALDRYVESYNIGSDSLEMSLSLPSQAKRDAEQAICDGCADYIVSALLGWWFIITQPDSAGVYAERAASELESIVVIADSRRRAMPYEL